MKNFLKTSALAVLILAGFVTAPLASSPNQIANASFELYESGNAICSGEFVTPTEFLTAGHCIKDDGKYSIVIEHDGTKQTFDLKVKTVNKYFDTATLTVVDDHAAFPYVDVSKNYIPTEGDEVLAANYPNVLGYLFETKGTMGVIVKGPEGLPGDYHYTVSMLGAPGSSGGGLYVKNGNEYELIGTVSGGHTQYNWISFYSVLAGVLAVI